MTLRIWSWFTVHQLAFFAACVAFAVCTVGFRTMAVAQPSGGVPSSLEHPALDAKFPLKTAQLKTAQPIQFPTGRFPKEGATPTDQHSIRISSQYRQEWNQDGKQFVILRGQCKIQQGDTTVLADQMIVSRSVADQARVETLQVYAEKVTNDVQIIRPGQKQLFARRLLKMVSKAGVTIQSVHAIQQVTAKADPFYVRASVHFEETVQAGSKKRIGSKKRAELLPTQFEQPVLPPVQVQPGPPIGSLQLPSSLTPRRHVLISPRSSTPYNLSSHLSKNTTPPEQTVVLTQGVNIIVDGLKGLGKIDLTADNMVIWTQANEEGRFSPEMFQSNDMPLQIYLEGNIEIRQDGTLVRASSAFYDVREERALMIDSELTRYVPQMQGNIRLRAKQIRQLSRDRYQAQGAWFTGSRMGYPTYRVEAETLFLENRYPRFLTSTSPMQTDPDTGASRIAPTPWVTSSNNRFLLGDATIFSLPYISGPANIEFIPLRRIEAGYDSVFGFQVESDWDLFQLTGMGKREGMEWDLLLNEYTERGPAIGTNFDYEGLSFFRAATSSYGSFHALYQYDSGNDVLGLDRRSLAPKDENRGHIQWQHREMLPFNMTLTAELGFTSDRNYEEQYHEQEWDTQKDSDTLLELSQQFDNLTWSVMGQFQVNDFEYGTEWLPRGDLTLLSEPLLDGMFNWSTRSSVGYGRINSAEAPKDPVSDLFAPVPYHPSASGMVAYTRHELNMPFHLGAIKVVPYVLGEAAYWQDDGFTGDNLNRLYGSAGARASLSFWKVMPYVRSSLFNLNGLAHKHTLSAEYFYADSSKDLSSVPQYNNIDDNAQERFRTRLLTNTFGGVLPGQFDPRGYAVRSGLGQSVSTPYHELVDDQHVLRVNSRHRLQTKVGPPQNLKIQDWMILDLGMSYFPNADDNNFGEDIGLLTANYEWNLGARTRLLANAQFDLFDNAAELWDIGLLSQRSTRGSVYLGYRQYKAGPLESQLVTASASYALSKKWITTLGTAYDIQGGTSRGQSLTITRAGPDFLIHFGTSYDASKDNFGISLSIEPRIGSLGLKSTQLSSLLGTRQ